MKIIPFTYHDEDDLCANTYVLVDETNSCVVVDPSVDYNGIIDYINKNSLTLKAVLLTHSHFDHMRGVDRLKNKFKCPLYVGFDDIDGLTDISKNCSRYYGKWVRVESKALPVSDNDILNVVDEPIKVIYTPYHTCGSVCYYLQQSNLLLSGDSLFKMAIGRSDLPTSTPESTEESLMKLFRLPDETKVYPGHGAQTTIKSERKGNGFIK